MSSQPPSNSNINTSPLSGRKRKLPDPPGQSDNEPSPVPPPLASAPAVPVPPPAPITINTTSSTTQQNVRNSGGTNMDDDDDVVVVDVDDVPIQPPPAVKPKLEPTEEKPTLQTQAQTQTQTSTQTSTPNIVNNTPVPTIHTISKPTAVQSQMNNNNNVELQSFSTQMPTEAVKATVLPATVVKEASTTSNVPPVAPPPPLAVPATNVVPVATNVVPVATAPVATIHVATVPVATIHVPPVAKVQATKSVTSANNSNIVKASSTPAPIVVKPVSTVSTVSTPANAAAPIMAKVPIVAPTNTTATITTTSIPSKTETLKSVHSTTAASASNAPSSSSSSSSTKVLPVAIPKPATTVMSTKEVKIDLAKSSEQQQQKQQETALQDVQMVDASLASPQTEKIMNVNNTKNISSSDDNNNNNNNNETKEKKSLSKDVEMKDVEKSVENDGMNRSNQDVKMVTTKAPATMKTGTVTATGATPVATPVATKATTPSTVQATVARATTTTTTKPQSDIFPSLTLEDETKTPHILNLIKSTKMYENPKPNEKVNWETTKTILQSQDFAQVLSTLVELRDDFELLYSAEYASALKVLVPAFMTLIKGLPCTPPNNPFSNSNNDVVKTTGGSIGGDSNNIEDISLTSKTTLATNYIYSIRNTILELSTLFPLNDTLRPYVIQLVTMVIDVLRTDYEDNALLASKIIVELHKNYRMILSDYAEQYLEFVLMSYRSLSSNVQQNFTFKATMQNVESSNSSRVDGVIGTIGIGQESSTTPATTSSAPTTSSSSSSLQQEQSIIIDHALKSANSFRILTECPLTVILIFQLYPQFIKRYLMQLLPLMMEALGQRPPPFAATFTVPTMTPTAAQQVVTAAVTTAATSGAATLTNLPASNTITTTASQTFKQQEKEYQIVAKKIYMKRSRELLSAQVKTLTFVTFLLSRYGEQMKPFEDHLATNVLNLFQMCPREAIVTRKDLLLALKHIFMTDFRKGFYKHIDMLLDDRVLIGKHKQSEHTHLRVEAYSALATLIPHVCSKMSMIQVSRVVHLYSRVLHDASMNLPLKSQMMSVNLMLCLIDTVYNNREERASLGRDILYRILENLVWKMGTFAKSAELKEDSEAGGKIVESDESNRDSMDIDTSHDVKYRKAEKERQILRDRVYGDLSSNRKETKENVENIIKLILGGFKKLFWCINTYGVQRAKVKKNDKDTDKVTKDSKGTSIAPSMQSPQQCSWYEEMAMQTINLSEQKLIDSCLVWSLEAIRIFRKKKDTITDASSSTDFAKALEALSSAISVMDPYSFQQVVGPRIELLFDIVMEGDDAIVIFQKLLLQSSNISSTFASCLIKFFMTNITELLGGITVDDKGVSANSDRKSIVMQKIFEILFSSLSVNAKNEVELRPHLQMLIASCLRQTTNSDLTKCSGANLEILRKLFRAVAGGKFEESYKEILPLLSQLLNGLFHIFCRAKDEVLRKVIIELCLTIPARLSSLLPHLSLLIRIIVPALNTDDGDLINLG